MMLRASTNLAPAAVFGYESPVDKTSPEPYQYQRPDLISLSNAGGRGGREDERGHGDVEDSRQHVRGGVAGVAVGSKVWVDMYV